MRIAQLPFELRQKRDVVLFDDFARGFDTTYCWGTVLSGSGTAAAAGGIVSLTDVSTTANDELYVYSRQALFQPGNQGAVVQNLYMEATVQWVEANTNQLNLFFGIMSNVATGALVTANGGLRATGTAIGLRKQGGGTNWIAHAQNPSGVSSALDDLSATPAGNSTSYTTLGINVFVQGSLTGAALGSWAEISYTVDGVLLRYNSNPQQVIKHQIDLTGLPNAQLCLLARTGTTATSAEVVNIDYLHANIVRAYQPAE
ncbi:hypothetical protein [Frigoriglobus tundricola]|uniref:Uncharacterized protein n=1 Tax=Frigoriglobus tundricola TaxID=2774151 RepID=A0A6M5YX42_9BACT|nr:hypothetical protein [Frigoriglobus tundricola]QJW98677.1 hypothetical protein FTUN_6272 [Frigoriglobus tundricola]